MNSSFRSIAVAIVVGVLAWAASCAAPTTEQTVSDEVRECTYNSDCDAPLVCLYGECVAECKAQVDCPEGYDCVNSSCELGNGAGGGTPLPEYCSNGIKDAEETDIDCGGMCAPCAESQACSSGDDCASKNCLMGVCQASTCSDGLHNGDESDVDCGGVACPSCDNGGDCNSAADCVSGICAEGTCVDPSCVDGIKNGDETDVDCGGSCATCDPTKGCQVGSDCTSGVCGEGGTYHQ